MASKLYRKGERISNKQMNSLPIERKYTFPQWNYSILPHGSKQKKM
jgi:hypothetical protein